MIEKLKKTEDRYLAIEREMEDPAVAVDPVRTAALMKEYKNLTPVVQEYRTHQKALLQEKEAREILSEKPDDELKALAEEELENAIRSRQQSLERLKLLLLPWFPTKA